MNGNVDTLTRRRPIRSYQAEPDVNRMLVRADREGFSASKVANLAIREWLIAKGFGRKKDTSADNGGAA